MLNGLGEFIVACFLDIGPLNAPMNAFRTYNPDGMPIDYYNALQAALPIARNIIGSRMTKEEITLASIDADISSVVDEQNKDTNFDAYIYDRKGRDTAQKQIDEQNERYGELQKELERKRSEQATKISGIKSVLSMPDSAILNRLVSILRGSGPLPSVWPARTRNALPKSSGPVKADDEGIIIVKLRDYLPGFLTDLLGMPEENGWVDVALEEKREPDCIVSHDNTTKFMASFNSLFPVWAKVEPGLLDKFHPLRSTRNSIYRTRKHSAIALLIALDERMAKSSGEVRLFSIEPAYNPTEQRLTESKLMAQIANEVAANSSKLDPLLFQQWALLRRFLYDSDKARNRLLQTQEIFDIIDDIAHDGVNIAQKFYERTIEIIDALKSLGVTITF
jgi:hypothetical protein